MLYYIKSNLNLSGESDVSKKEILKAAALGLMAFSSGEASAQTNTDDIKNKTEEITPDIKSLSEEGIKETMDNVPLGSISTIKTVDIKGRKVKILKKQQVTIEDLNQLGASQDHIQPGSENMSRPDINTVRLKRAEQDLLTACKRSGFDMNALNLSYIKDHKGMGISCDDNFLYGIEYSNTCVTNGAQKALKNPDMARYVSYYRHVIENSADSALVKGAQSFLQQLNKQYPETKEEVKSSTLGLDNPANPFYHAAKESWFSND